MSQVEDRPYTYFEKFKSQELQREGQCFRILLSAIPPGYVPNVSLELFGGIGLLLSLVPSKWRSKRYYVWDHDEECVARVRRDYPEVTVSRVDSFTQSFPMGLQFISADFNTFTILQWASKSRYISLMDRVFGSGADYIQITDSAVSKLHLNGRYYNSFWPGSEQRCIETLEDYVEAFSDRAFWFYDYRVIKAACHHGASYLLLQHKARKRRIVPEKVS